MSLQNAVSMSKTRLILSINIFQDSILNAPLLSRCKKNFVNFSPCIYHPYLLNILVPSTIRSYIFFVVIIKSSIFIFSIHTTSKTKNLLNLQKRDHYYQNEH